MTGQQRAEGTNPNTVTLAIHLVARETLVKGVDQVTLHGDKAFASETFGNKEIRNMATGGEGIKSFLYRGRLRADVTKTVETRGEGEGHRRKG